MRSRIGATLLWGLFMLSPAGAHAFSSQGHRWANQESEPVPWEIDPAGSEDVTDGSDIEAVRRAFATWESVACAYLTFSETEWSGQKILANDLVNRIFWVETAEEWPGPEGTLALTYTFYTLDQQSRITDADMIVNGSNWVWTTTDSEIGQGTPAKVDVETVIFHEVGHFFGLDHSNDPQAAMYASNNKQKQRTPAADDIAGICSLYSNGQPIPDDPNNPTGNEGGPVGAPCQAPVDCASNLCVNDELLQRQYCTAQCAPERPEDCPAGFLCEATEQGGFCLAPAPVDEVCDQCSNGSHCASGLCIQVPNVNNSMPFCSRACDPTPGQPQQCPDGFSCVATQQATTQIGACIPNTGICEPKGKGGQNEPCFGNGACKAGHACLEYYPGTGITFCYGICPIQLDGSSCGTARSRCTAIEGIMNAAACLTVASAGQPCIPEVCDQFSFCAYDEKVGIDSALCYLRCDTGGCPPNSSCQTFQGIPPLCVPNAGFKSDGDACAGNAECQSNLCQNIGQAKLCTRVCAAGNAEDCDPGLHCVPEPGSSQGLCWPQSISDPNARDPTREVTEVPEIPGYCSCDFTNECDEGCECDQECGGPVCSCTSAAGEERSVWWALSLPLLLWVRRRR